MVKRPPVRPYHIAWCLIRRCAEPAQRQPNYCFQTATKGQSCKLARSDYAIIPGEQPLSHYGLGGPSPRMDSVAPVLAGVFQQITIWVIVNANRLRYLAR